MWVTMQRVSAMLFNFLKITVLTHFLSPSEFGIFGVALITLSVISSFTQTGFNEALIQKKGNIQPYLNSSWTFRILRSVVVAVILFAIAPWAAAFFNSHESVVVIRAITGIIIIRAFVNIADIYLRKNLDFKTQFFYLSGGEVIDVALSIIFAIVLQNFWALYIGFLGRSVYRLIVSFIIFRFRPKLELDLQKIGELFRFGKWILAGSVIVIFSMYFDNIMVGKLIGIAALGIYQVGFKFSHTGSGELTNVLSQIYFPYFSVIQDNKKEMETSYLNLLKLNIIIMTYIAMGMITLAPAFTILFLDSKWHSIIGIIQILAIASFLHSVVETSSPFFKGKGKPKLVMFYQAVKVFALVVLVFLLAKPYGIKGVAYSVVFSELASIIYWFVVLRKMIPGFFMKMVHIAAAPAIVSVIMGIVISLFWIIPGKENVDLTAFQFFAGGIVGTAIFAGLLFMYMRIDPTYRQGLTIKKIIENFTGKQ